MGKILMYKILLTCKKSKSWSKNTEVHALPTPQVKERKTSLHSKPENGQFKGSFNNIKQKCYGIKRFPKTGKRLL